MSIPGQTAFSRPLAGSSAGLRADLNPHGRVSPNTGAGPNTVTRIKFSADPSDSSRLENGHVSSRTQSSGRPTALKLNSTLTQQIQRKNEGRKRHADARGNKETKPMGPSKARVVERCTVTRKADGYSRSLLTSRRSRNFASRNARDSCGENPVMKKSLVRNLRLERSVASDAD